MNERINKKRIFVSIDLPKDSKDALKSIIRPDVYWIKWLAPHNFHITLNFLGDLSTSEINSAKEVIAGVSALYQPFHLKLQFFRGEEDMLWLVPEKNETLDKLQWELRLELKKAGIGKRERRTYLPHVLVAKSKTGRRMSWKPDNFRPIEFRVESVNLYESVLAPGVATHTLIQSFALEKMAKNNES